MDYTKNIPVADLKVKLKELEHIIEKAQKEMDHIHYVLKNFVPQEVSTKEIAKEIFGLENNQNTQSNKEEKSLSQVMSSVFKENPSLPLSTGFIRTKMNEKGFKIADPTFYSYLNRFMNNGQIKKVDRGMYQFIG